MGFGILAALMPPQKQQVRVDTEASSPTEGLNKQEYFALAKRAGWTGAATAVDRDETQRLQAEELQRFRRFLAENGICVYKPRRVEHYMNSITPYGYRWVWSGVSSGGYTGVYVQPIPEPVLITMARIREAFPKVQFEVTEIHEVPKGDPFLRAGLHGAWFIIERWNEPGFRM